MIELAPSLLAADFTRLGEQINEISRLGVSCLHLDVMDGFFVPSISFGMPLIASLRPQCAMFFDLHLMISEPERYIDEFVASGADNITVHLEACADPQAVIDRIHAKGVRAGLAIKPDTPPETIIPYLRGLERVLVMCVHPGFGGQSFIPASLERIATVKEYLEKEQLSADIQVDGGLYQHNVRPVLAAGANVIVAGTAVFKGDIADNVKGFQTVFDGYHLERQS